MPLLLFPCARSLNACLCSKSSTLCHPHRPLRSRVCGNVLICGALAQSCQSAVSRKTQISLQAITALFFFPFPIIATESVPPNSGVEETVSVTYQLQLPFLCDKAHMGRLVATGQLQLVQKLSPVTFTKKEIMHKRFGQIMTHINDPSIYPFFPYSRDVEKPVTEGRNPTLSLFKFP